MPDRSSTSRATAPSLRRPLALALLVALAAASSPTSVRAQDRPAPAEDAPSRKALDEARDALHRSEEARERIRVEIEALKGERGKLQDALISAAAAIREREGGVEAREARIGELAESERQVKASLVERRKVLADVIAALQRMGRQPPPALLVRPDDMLEALRSAMLLGAVVPEMRAEAEALGSDLRELVRLRELAATERDALTRELDGLASERVRLSALVEERRRQLGQREDHLAEEAQRAGAIAKDVRDLETLIARMEQEQAARAAQEAAKPRASDGGSALAALGDTRRLAPAAPFDKMRGLLPMPVSGKAIRTFGGQNDAGGVEKGLSIATSPGATVSAPADGWVVYAGPFRSYGQLLILNAGGGYHILLAGMDRITVGLNQFVLAGEPVASMGGDRPRPSRTAGSATERPVLYVEFRNDRGSIDPSPWWAAARGEKVGG